MRPRFSIVMPVHAINPEWLRRSIQSVFRQTNTDREWSAVDDASLSNAARFMLKAAAALDPRLAARFLPENLGIGLALE